MIIKNAAFIFDHFLLINYLDLIQWTLLTANGRTAIARLVLAEYWTVTIPKEFGL